VDLTFKVGDHVRINAPLLGSPGDWNGQVGVVRHIRECKYPYLVVLPSGSDCAFKADELELVKEGDS
jgi:hypothetical protein